MLISIYRFAFVSVAVTLHFQNLASTSLVELRGARAQCLGQRHIKFVACTSVGVSK